MFWDSVEVFRNPPLLRQSGSFRAGGVLKKPHFAKEDLAGPGSILGNNKSKHNRAPNITWHGLFATDCNVQPNSHAASKLYLTCYPFQLPSNKHSFHRGGAEDTGQIFI